MTELRITQMLSENWKFIQDDDLSDEEALGSSGDDWETVSLPHTWNAEDGASYRSEDYKRGTGWYRLAFVTPTAGVRHWIEFGAASLVADVWLNGDYLGQHKGGFTSFRFDVTNDLAKSGQNVLLVKVDNNLPREPDDVTAIAPLGGDFNVSGGLYRYVSLVSTPEAVHFALGDAGGSGVYATTESIADGVVSISVTARVRSYSYQAEDCIVRISLLDDAGGVAVSQEQAVPLEANGAEDLVLALQVANPHLWHGRADPYLYALVAEIMRSDGAVIDRVVKNYGIREMRFDAKEGLFLNGEHMRLNGVAMHQDYLGKAWATSQSDWDTSFDLISEIGANAIRLGHYPFPAYALQRADELGFVVWSETALGPGTTVNDAKCGQQQPTAEFVENARLQLEEMILQHFNHPSIGMWSVGNESSAREYNCDEPIDNVSPVLESLHSLAKDLDPKRPTAYAEFGHPVVPGERTGVMSLEGITDLLATNRYFLWYNPGLSQIEPILDGLHALTPDQPLGISEYGAGGAISHHTDNPLGGYPDIRSAPDGETSYQPEEYQAYVHEQNWQVFQSKEYLWGTFVWNMFDFGSSRRKEGDVLGVNTKGLVTFDRQTRKDAFFFYKANWSVEPVIYIAGRRYTERAYAVNDVKIYSNADTLELSVNGTVVGTMTADRCPYKICVFPGVQLSPGANTVSAVGNFAGEMIRDEVVWNFSNPDINIAAGRLASGLTSPQGDRFGSDNFFIGGTFEDPGDPPTPDNFEGPSFESDPLPEVYQHFRHGEFSYEIPAANGDYRVTLGFMEPFEHTQVGERVFDVIANGETVVDDFDVLKEAGAPHQGVSRSFPVNVSDGLIRLQFTPSAGEAIVSTIRITADTGGSTWS